MGPEIDLSNTLNLIAAFSLDRSSRKRKNDASDTPNKKVKRKEMVFSKTVEMATAMRERIIAIGGFDIRIVIQKQLQDTDRSKNHGRLSIPMKKLLNDFVTEEESRFLSEQDEEQKERNGMNVLIVDPLLRESVIGLKMWKVGSGDIYCLVSEWNSFAQRNSLESGDYIQLWSFRKNGLRTEERVSSNLCFAMVKLDISQGIFQFI